MFEAGQDFDLRAGNLAEAFATLRASAGPLTARGSARYAGFASRPPSAGDPLRRLDDWTEMMGALRLQSRRGHELHAEIRSVGAGGPPSAQGGVDALFDLRPTPIPSTAQASAGFRLPIGPATIGYDLLFPPREVTVPACDTSNDPGATRRLGAFHVQQHAASFVWESPCHCFRLAAQVKLNECDGFDPRSAGFTVGIDLSPREPVGAVR
jgi:hypothetical protein